MIDIDSLQLILLNIGFAVHHADWNYKMLKSFCQNISSKEGSANYIYPMVEYRVKAEVFIYGTPIHLA